MIQSLIGYNANMKEILGIIAVMLGFLSVIPYILDMYRGKSKPHIFTYIIWTIVTTLAFLGQLASGAGPGAWTTGFMAGLTLLILLLSIKYGTKDITRWDTIFLITGLLAIIPWLLTHNPTISVLIATAVDICGFFPTIRKTLNDPSSESVLAWELNLLRHAVSLFALNSIVVATYIYPLALLFMSAIVVYIILRGKRQQFPSQCYTTIE